MKQMFLCVNEAYLSRYTTLSLTTTVLGLETIFLVKQMGGWINWKYNQLSSHLG